MTGVVPPSAHHPSHEPGGSDALAVDAPATTGSLRTLGLGAQQAASGADSRFTDARVPTAHRLTHEAGGGDPILNLSGSVLTSGTVADARLPANLARTDASNIFTQVQGITSAPNPLLAFAELSQPVGLRRWNFIVAGGDMYVQPATDAGAGLLNALILTRVGDNHVSRDLTVGRSATATNGYYERARTTPIGEWLGFTPTFGASSGTVSAVSIFGGQYMLLGKTMFISMYVTMTLSALTNFVYFAIPGGLAAAVYTPMPALSNGGTVGMAQTAPSDSTIRIYRDIGAIGNWPAGATSYGVQSQFQIL